jgi:hypothetical protein
MTRERWLDALFLAAGLAALSVTPKLLRPDASYAEGLRSPLEPLAMIVIAQPIVLLGACVFAAGSSRRFETGSPVRAPWTLLAIGLFGFVVGEAIQAVYAALWSTEPPFPSLSDVLFLAAYPLLVAAFVLFVRAYRLSGYPVGTRQGTFVSVCVVLLTVVGCVLLAPVLRSVAPPLERAVSASSVVFDLVVLAPVLLLLRTTWPFRGGGVFKVWAGVLFGFLLTFAGDLLFAYFRAHPGGVAGLGGDQLNALSDVMFLLSYLAIARGTLHQLHLLGPRLGEDGAVH